MLALCGWNVSWSQILFPSSRVSSSFGLVPHNFLKKTQSLWLLFHYVCSPSANACFVTGNVFCFFCDLQSQWVRLQMMTYWSELRQLRFQSIHLLVPGIRLCFHGSLVTKRRDNSDLNSNCISPHGGISCWAWIISEVVVSYTFCLSVFPFHAGQLIIYCFLQQCGTNVTYKLHIAQTCKCVIQPM